MAEKDPSPAPRTKRDLGPEAHDRAMAARRNQFRRLYDFSQGRGLEIGPLDRAIAVGGDADVRYVDVHGTAEMRAHFAQDPNVLVEQIPEIDFTLVEDGQIRSLSEAAAPGAPYDWVIASHVVEHVPDMIGWLADIASVTKVGGALVLAVPDRRYCFDRHRPPTTTGQAIAAFEAHDARPTARAIYDHFRSAVVVDTAALWSGARPPGREARMYTLEQVKAQLELGRAGEYVDSHVWTFTPRSFRSQIDELRELGLCPWSVETLEEVRNDVEFHVVLRHVPEAEISNDATTPAAVDLPDWLEDEWNAHNRVRELEASVRALRRRNKRLGARIGELERSTSMRIGRAVIRPAAAVRRRLRRQAG